VGLTGKSRGKRERRERKFLPFSQLPLPPNGELSSLLRHTLALSPRLESPSQRERDIPDEVGGKQGLIAIDSARRRGKRDEEKGGKKVKRRRIESVSLPLFIPFNLSQLLLLHFDLQISRLRTHQASLMLLGGAANISLAVCPARVSAAFAWES